MKKYFVNLCFWIILTSFEPYPNKLDNHATFLSSMECEMKHIFQSMPLRLWTILGNMKKYSSRVEKIMPGTEIPEEKSFSFGGINVPVGRNNHKRHGKLEKVSFSFFWKNSSEKIVLENGKKARKYKFNLCFLIILTSIEPFPNKGDNHATFLSAMECEIKHIFQSMPLLFCT